MYRKDNDFRLMAYRTMAIGLRRADELLIKKELASAFRERRAPRTIQLLQHPMDPDTIRYAELRHETYEHVYL